MKLLDSFIQLNNNKPLEVYDPTNKNQCVDLVLGWVKELGLGDIIPLGIGPAYDLWNKTHKLSPHVDKIPNTPDGVPQAGDIVVWSSKYGPAGHTAVATGKGNATSFEAFSQNDPTGKPCILKTYTYTNVLGWLRPKKLPIEQPNMSDQDKKDVESMRALRSYSNVWYEAKDIIKEYEDRKKEIAELQEGLSKKSEVISKQSEQLLGVRADRDEAVARAEKAEAEARQKEELRAKWYAELQQARKDMDFIREQRDVCYKDLKKERETSFDIKKISRRDLVAELLRRVLG